MLLGNEKLPVLMGLGHVNMYMCQFPFDLDRPAQPQHVKAFSTYDYVLLNSEFTDRCGCGCWPAGMEGIGACTLSSRPAGTQ